MNDLQSKREFRLKNGSIILNYIRQFSSTEKVVFGLLVIIAGIMALIMANKVNNMFITEIPASGGDLQEGIVGLPRTINPVLAITDADRDISALVYSGLMKYENGKIITDLAKSYQISKDGLIYTFILRDDAKFDDGTPLTAEDIVYTINKIQDPVIKSPRASDWANVTVSASSSKVVNFVLKQSYSPFLTNVTIGIIPKHIWGNLSDEQFIFSKYNTEPVGSGPYKVASIDRDSGNIPTKYHLETSNYQQNVPNISRITFTFFGDEEKALSALNDGVIQSLDSISPPDASILASNSAEPYKILSSPLPRIFGVFFNQNQASVLADKNVRIALNMSVDRESIVKKAIAGFGMPINSPLPVGISANIVSSQNISDAKALLEKNGWKKNATTGIYEKKGAKNTVQTLSFDIYTADSSDLKQAAEIVKQNWTDLGAQVGVKIFDASDLYQNVIRTRKYDALLFGEFVGKDKDLFAFWHSSQRNAPGLNVAMYTNSKVDKLLEDIRSSNDDDSKTSKYAQFEQLITADVPAIFLYVPDFIYAVPKSVKNISLGTIVSPSDRWNSINNWYINTEKVWKIFANNN